MLKRLFDLVFGLSGLLVFSPFILAALFAVWLQDKKNPIYASKRIGKGAKDFPFYKIRTMVIGADKAGRHTVGSDDPNVTKLGRFLRNSKLDELLQFYSVIRGDMSMVGPRPNIAAASKDVFTEREMEIFSVKPGITDFASIVFSDLDKIMIGSTDVNHDYTTRIRPWKSRLCLFYVDNACFAMDVRLLFLTALNFVKRPAALKGAEKLLSDYNADAELIAVARRDGRPPEKEPPSS